LAIKDTRTKKKDPTQLYRALGNGRPAVRDVINRPGLLGTAQKRKKDITASNPPLSGYISMPDLFALRILL
jgi:hypothetical protein